MQAVARTNVITGARSGIGKATADLLSARGERVLCIEAYPEKLAARGLECIRPNADEREEMNRIIMDELVCGITTPKGIAFSWR